MSPLLQAASRHASWGISIGTQPCGFLELYQAEAGYVWHWREKPAHLVEIVGVLDDSPKCTSKPFRFFEVDSALDHIMHTTGIAFRGGCGLHSLH